MPYELLGDPGFHRELEGLPTAAQTAPKAALRAFLEHPLRHPKVARLHGSRYPGSFRLRAGPMRVLGIVLDGPRLVLVTTVFVKKRDSDYVQALSRHERRMEAQGPPLDEYLRSARKRS